MTDEGPDTKPDRPMPFRKLLRRQVRDELREGVREGVSELTQEGSRMLLGALWDWVRSRPLKRARERRRARREGR